MNDERGLDPVDKFFAELGLADCSFGCNCGADNSTDTKGEAMKMNQFAEDMWDIVDRMGNVLLDKQSDYGPLNIANAPGGALNGLRVRIFDKVARINNLIDTGADPKNESLYDSFLDLANYGVIAMMVLNGTWPELKDNQ